MSDAVSRARHQNYELTDVPLVDERSMHGPPVPSSMVLRFSLALLVILGTYLGAVTVERTFSWPGAARLAPAGWWRPFDMEA